MSFSAAKVEDLISTRTAVELHPCLQFSKTGAWRELERKRQKINNVLVRRDSLFPRTPETPSRPAARKMRPADRLLDELDPCLRCTVCGSQPPHKWHLVKMMVKVVSWSTQKATTMVRRLCARPREHAGHVRRSCTLKGAVLR